MIFSLLSLASTLFKFSWILLFTNSSIFSIFWWFLFKSISFSFLESFNSSSDKPYKLSLSFVNSSIFQLNLFTVHFSPFLLKFWISLSILFLILFKATSLFNLFFLRKILFNFSVPSFSLLLFLNFLNLLNPANLNSFFIFLFILFKASFLLLLNSYFLICVLILLFLFSFIIFLIVFILLGWICEFLLILLIKLFLLFFSW